MAERHNVTGAILHLAPQVQMHVKTVSTWRQLAGLNFSPFGAEQLVAQFIYFTCAAISYVHATGKLLNLLE